MCKSCKKAFISSPQEETVCSDCAARLRGLYPLVREFLRNNDREVYTAQDISRIMGIDLKDVDCMVSMGLIEYQPSGKSKVMFSGKGSMHILERKKVKSSSRRQR